MEHDHDHPLEISQLQAPGAQPEVSHSHTHTQTKAVVNRMARLIGHLEHTKKMVEEGRDCSEILIQLSAVDAAIRSVGRVILKDHISHCIVDAAREGDSEAIEKLNKALDQFLK